MSKEYSLLEVIVAHIEIFFVYYFDSISESTLKTIFF